MPTFEQLQVEKAERAGKLLELLPRLAAAELSGTDVSSTITGLADNLKSLLDKVKKQKLLSWDEQVHALLDQEVHALEGKHKALGCSIIVHIEKAAKEKNIDIAAIREALILMASRRDSLTKLPLDTGQLPSRRI